MHSLDTYDLLLHITVLVMMPLIIWANLRRAALHTPFNAYLWRENTNLMRVAVLILVMLTLFSACALLADFGLISPAVEEATTIVIGIPFMLAAVAMIVLSIVAVVRAVRYWRG